MMKRSRVNQKLWKSLENSAWQDALSLLSSILHNRSVDQPLPSDRRLVAEVSAKLPILSLAIYKNAPMDVLKTMIRCDPLSVVAEDTLGRLPLHMAAMLGQNADLVDLLLTIDPNLAACADRQGNLPIHYAVQAACNPDLYPDSLDILESLLATSQASSAAANQCRQTPVDLARRLDLATKKHVYTMLLNTAVLFDAVHHSKELTLSSTTEASETVEDDGWADVGEAQAIGMRPPRRNACANILLAMQ